MKKCNSCNINFNTKDEFCPLCQNKLYGINGESIFPKNIRKNTHKLILKTLLFCSLVICIISTFIELYVFNKINYNLYVYLGFITNYWIIYFNINNSKNVLKMFIKYGIFLIFLTLIWYFVTKGKFIVNYIIPSIALGELLFNIIIGFIIRRNYFIKYSNLILMNLFILILPALLVLFDLTTNNLMSYICLVSALITIVGLIIFYFDDIKEELLKLFNI